MTQKYTQKSIDLYASALHPCNYLPDEETRLLYIDPNFPITTEFYGQFIQQGFRRTGNEVYRPGCPNCSECLSARIPVKNFSLSKSQKRIIRWNADLETRFATPSQSDKHRDLYQRYLSARHQPEDDTDEPQSIEEKVLSYQSFVESQWGETKFLEMYLADKLVAIAAVDFINTGLSAVYTFFDPTLSKRSLGTYAILQEIAHCQQLKLPYLYLGYWVKECQKMQYKGRFRPLEIFKDNFWQPVE